MGSGVKGQDTMEKRWQVRAAGQMQIQLRAQGVSQDGPSVGGFPSPSTRKGQTGHEETTATAGAEASAGLSRVGTGPSPVRNPP